MDLDTFKPTFLIQIEAFRECQTLSAELVGISERLADEEAEKWGSGRRSKK